MSMILKKQNKKIKIKPVLLLYQSEQNAYFLQINCCKNIYHQSQRVNIKITVNIKVINGQGKLK